jgi:hypothetical protein
MWILSTTSPTISGIKSGFGVLRKTMAAIMNAKRGNAKVYRQIMDTDREALEAMLIIS